MDNANQARSDVEAAMRRLLAVVAETQRQNALSPQETAYDAALGDARPGLSLISPDRTQRARW